MRQILSAVGYCHRNGVCHRDARFVIMLDVEIPRMSEDVLDCRRGCDTVAVCDLCTFMYLDYF